MISSLRTIAGHRLVAGLGHGGMARVYLAISQKPLGFTKLVVLKVLREELDVDGDLLEMFIQEARLAARLNHLHVVQTDYDGTPLGLVHRDVSTWAGPFALAARATSPIIQRIDHATGHAELAPPRATRVERSATAREPEPNRLRPLDGNPWETPK